MSRNLAIAAICCWIGLAANPPCSAGDARPKPVAMQRLTINYNSGWLFRPGEVIGGQSDTLNENGFEPVCLPHANVIVPHRDIDMQSFRNISWYRNHFSPAAEYRGKRFFLEFEGASQVTDVFVNNTPVGIHRGAYTPFSFDITNFIKFGVDNVIAVRADSRRHPEIPPEGIVIDYMLFGGITRDVAITITDPLHVEWVFASLDSVEPTRVNIRCRIKNSSTTETHFSVGSQLIDTTGAVVANGKSEGTVGPDSAIECTYATGPVAMLHLWDTEHPYLYTVRTRLKRDTAVIDECTDRTGLRSISFSKTDGRFYLNNKPLWLHGLNRHETFPFIGRAAANRLQAKDAEILKYQLGCNIVRCSHYPQDPEFLQRCDEIGLLVLEEIPGWIYIGDTAWQRISLMNVEEMVVRDRNHPSVISYGVRINESRDLHEFYEKTNRLARTLDPTRPTHGVRVKDRGSPSEFIEDIWTKNFIIPKGKPPLLPWLITESVGIGCQVHSWDAEELLIGKMLRFAEVMDSVAANVYIAGELGWCAFDYNSSHLTADRTTCYYGAADIYRISKHAGNYLKTQADPATVGPQVYIAHYWQKKLAHSDVWVAGNCDQVELFVNGTSLGKKTPDRYPSLPHPLTVWKGVRFTPGEIRAVGYLGDTIAATHVRITPGVPVALKLIPDDTLLVAGGDMTRVVVVAIDSCGQIVPASKNAVALSASGAADFIGQNLIALEDGKTAFYVKTRTDATGSVLCRAESRGLTTASTRLKVVGDPQAALRQRVLGTRKTR